MSLKSDNVIIFKGTFEGSPDQNNPSYIDGKIRFSNLSKKAQKIYLDEYVPERMNCEISANGYSYFSDFLEEFGLKEKSDTLVIGRIRSLLQADDISSEVGIYSYYTPAGEHLGDLDDNIYEPEEGFLFSSLSEPAQNQILRTELENVHFHYDFGKDIYLGILSQLGVIDAFNSWVREEITDELNYEEVEYDAKLIFSESLKLQFISHLNIQDLKPSHD